MSRHLQVDWADLDFDTYEIPDGGNIGVDETGKSVSVFDKHGVEIAAFYGVRSWKKVAE